MDEGLRKISDCLEATREIANTYEIETKKEYGVDENYQGPSWYKYQHNLWFRGQADYDWPLLPQVCRSDFQESATRSKDSVSGYEKSAFNQFIIRANHLIENEMSISEQYFLAQHYGLPTRLLDWTTNPLTALFFAVSNSKHEQIDGAFFAFLSRNDMPGYEHEGLLYNHRDAKTINSLIKEILHEKKGNDFFKYPVRIIPNNQAGRIILQSSRFTLYLNNSKKYDIGNPAIFKINIPWKYKKSILKELSLLNINRSTLFMDMESIIADIKSEMIG